MANEVTPYYEPGNHMTGLCKAAVRGGRFAKVDGTVSPGWQPEGLKATSEPNVVPVVEATAGAVVVGVFQKDQAINKLVTVMRSPGMVIPVTAGAAIVPGVAVESDGQGRAITLASGVRVGVAWSRTAAAGETVAVEMD